MAEYITREEAKTALGVEAEISTTADVRHVARGRWKQVGSIMPIYECDQCHAITLGGNFCPSCGAKMIEE